MHASTVAIDLAKEVFELAFADARGRVIERKRLSRKAFARVMEQRPPLRLLMEACGSAHYWGRRFQRQGHTVRLIPARDVRPYVRGNKTDRNDVAGILEADRCGDIAEVPLKTPEQQGVQALHRLREHLKGERTATLNLLRGVLREFGVVIAQGAVKVPAAVRETLEDGDNELPMALRQTLDEQLQRLAQLQADMAAIEQRLEEFALRDVAVLRYREVPGRLDHCNGPACQCWRSVAVSQWPAVVCMVGPDPARAFLRTTTPTRAPDQARRRLPAHAADPWRTGGAAGGADETATWASARSATAMGLVGAGSAGPQQGRLCAGQQAGAAVVGDGTPRPGLRSAPCQPATAGGLSSPCSHPQELPDTILIMAKGSVPKQTMPITIPALEAA